MKKLLFAIMFAVVSVYCHAQDIIVTIDGDRIECIIKTESDTEIKYTAWKDKKETLKTVPMSSVWSISYDESLHKNTPIVNTQPAVPQTQSSTAAGTSTSTTTGTHKFNSTTEGFMYNQAYKPYTMPNQKTKVKSSNGRGGYIFLGVMNIFAAVGSYAGGLYWALSADDTAGLVGGIITAVGGTVLFGCLSVPCFSHARELKYASVIDVPINDKLSVGLYDYALAPTQPHGAGVGLKFNF